MGNRYGTEPEQFRHSKLIIAWGANILGTNVHLWPFIVEARRNGAKFYTIDPQKNRTGKASDKHFFIYPGSDAALAFGMMHVIFRENLQDNDYIAKHTIGIEDLRTRAAAYRPERVEHLTGIPRDEVVQLAREYATTRPAVIRANYGVQRSERGGLSCQAIALLPAIMGSWKEVGGGMQVSTSNAFRVNVAANQREDLQQISLGRPARIVNMSLLGDALNDLQDPPVKSLFVYCSNPAAIAPDQSAVRRGLSRPDLFTVVMEQLPTDTTDFADIALPATTFLEHTDLYFAYGHYYLQMARPALPAPGEAKSNVEVFRLLAARMGFTDDCLRESEDDMIRTLLNSDHPYIKGITLEQLEERKFVRLNVSNEGEPFLPFAEGGFGTPEGKCDLRIGDYEPPVESRLGDSQLRSRYPLELVSAKNDDSMNSTFGNRPGTDEQTAVLEMNAADAGPRGIADGDAVRVHNDRGSMLLHARVNGRVPPGIVLSPAVRQPRKAPDKSNVNFLTSQRLTDMGGGPSFYNCLVQVERAGD